MGEWLRAGHPPVAPTTASTPQGGYSFACQLRASLASSTVTCVDAALQSGPGTPASLHALCGGPWPSPMLQETSCGTHTCAEYLSNKLHTEGFFSLPSWKVMQL